MTDIVERLRHEAKHWPPDMGTKPFNLLVEAADEIERLRAALEYANGEMDRAIPEIERLRKKIAMEMPNESKGSGRIGP